VAESILTLQLVYHIGQASLGRRRLSTCTGLSEMRVRLELERLRERGLLILRRSGAGLTGAGRRHFALLFDRVRAVREPELSKLQLDEVTIAALLAAVKTSPAWVHRDQAVREGAAGLVLLRFRSNHWCFAHNDEPVHLRNPQDAAAIESSFPERRDEDRMILAFGPDRLRAGLGLWRVVSDIVWSS
jgi:hypothetical protein